MIVAEVVIHATEEVAIAAINLLRGEKILPPVRRAGLIGHGVKRQNLFRKRVKAMAGMMLPASASRLKRPLGAGLIVNGS
jgi:hypothetical protein